MSVETQIERIKANISNAYASAETKGATIPEVKNSENLASCVDSITTGGGTQFGLTAEQMLGTVDGEGNLTYSTLPQPDFSGIVTLPNYIYYYKFYEREFAENTAIAFPDLTTVGSFGMYHTFEGCTSITSVSFPALASIDSSGMGYAFQRCASITSASFPALVNIGRTGMYAVFQLCTGITSASFPALASIDSGGMDYAFQRCEKLESILFPELTQVIEPFNVYTFNNCTALTEIHFRADMQATIEALTGYADKFGATNATIYFDL